MARNVASGNEHVAIQIGAVRGGKSKETPKTTAAEDPKTANVKADSATVGKQVEEVRGGLTINIGRRR